MKVFKIDIVDISLKFLIASVVLIILTLFSSKIYSLMTYVYLTLLVIGVEFLIYFLKKTLFKIEFFPNKIQLHFINFLIIKKVQTIDFEDFQFSFKHEIGAKGVKSEELRFYKNNQKIIGIGRGFDGWKKNVTKIIGELERLEIKRIN